MSLTTALVAGIGGVFVGAVGGFVGSCFVMQEVNNATGEILKEINERLERIDEMMKEGQNGHFYIMVRQGVVNRGYITLPYGITETEAKELLRFYERQMPTLTLVLAWGGPDGAKPAG